jgi:hypothetical protein
MRERHAWWAVARSILLSALVACVVGCGLKGKPVPPTEVVPRPPSDLRLDPVPEGVRVSCEVPQRNSDGSPLTDLDMVEILRTSGRPADCPTCPPVFSKVAELQYVYSGDAEIAKGKMEFLDRVGKPGSYQYRVVARNAHGEPSKPSVPVETFWDVPPREVRGVQIGNGDKRVDLRWDPVRERSDGSALTGDQVGYQVFRSRKGGGVGVTPLNANPLREPQWADTAVQNDTEYEYRVRAVLVVQGRVIPGPQSSVAEALPRRLVPPDPPGGVVAFGAASGVRVVWERVDKTDVTGFRVYRADGPDGPWTNLTGVPVSTGIFDDDKAVRGRTYWYAVTALDDSQPPRESERSRSVRVHFPAAPPPGAPAQRPAR